MALAAVKDFGAEVLVLSLGFDIFELDPQSKVAPSGFEATLKSATACLQKHYVCRFTTAAQPNGGKPPRHRTCHRPDVNVKIAAGR